jgi:hypothetical protein
MLAAGDYRRLDTLAAVAGDTSEVENGERHTLAFVPLANQHLCVIECGR